MLRLTARSAAMSVRPMHSLQCMPCLSMAAEQPWLLCGVVHTEPAQEPRLQLLSRIALHHIISACLAVGRAGAQHTAWLLPLAVHALRWAEQEAQHTAWLLPLAVHALRGAEQEAQHTAWLQ